MRTALIAVVLGVAGIVALSYGLGTDEPEIIESSAPTESTTTTSSAPTTTEPETTTTSSPPSTIEVTVADEGLEVLAPELTTDIEFAQLGDTFVRFRIQSSAETAYTAVVSRNGEPVETIEGVLAPEEIKTARVEGLEPGTVYSVQATLIGPPAVESSVSIFRTSGAAVDEEADAATSQVEMIDLTVTNLQHDNFQFDYLSNVCANGSFIILEQETGVEVGRNNGHPDACVGKHLGVPGFWTPPLTPETTYVVLVTLEANGENRGRPYSNTVTETLVVTTAARPVPGNPSDRGVDPVQITSVEQTETDHESIRIDYTTNVCSNGAFVVREVDGDEVGRHDGFPRGCATEHSAIPGEWTEALEADTDYVVIITAEADGAGQGDGNLTTEIINVRTEPLFPDPENPPPPLAIAGLNASVDGTTLSGSFTTNICAIASVAVFQTAADLVENIEGTDCVTQHEFGPIEVPAEGGYSIVVNAEAEDLSPTEVNRDSAGVVIPFAS